MPRHLVAFAFFLALAVAMTWPLALELSDTVPDLGDPLLNAWIVDWVCHALTHAPLDLFNAPMYYPARYALAFSENMTGIALIVLPLHIAGLPPLTVYNVALILGFAFSGYGAFVLARMITSNTIASLIGGTIYGFASFTTAHVQHLQVVWSGWLPLLLAALLFYWRRGTTQLAALVGAAFLMNGLTNIYWLLYGGVAILITIAFLQFADPRRDGAHWLRLGGALLIASLLLVPILLPYNIVANEYGARRTSFESRLGSATPLHWLVASSRNLVYGHFFTSWRKDERELFPGLVAIALVIAAAVRSRREPHDASLPTGRQSTRALDVAIVVFAALSIVVAIAGRIHVGRISFTGADVPAMITTVLVLWRLAPRMRDALARSRFTTEQWAGALWIVIGFLGSLGWNFYFHPFLFRVVTPFRATRTPARWAVIAYVGIAMWAAMGASRVRRGVAAVLLALTIADVAAHVRWNHPGAIPPVYDWIRDHRASSMIELPLTGEGLPFLYLLAQTRHRVPLVNGTSGFETPAHEELRKAEQRLDYGELFLRDAELLVVHEARLTDEQRNAMQPLLARLQPVAHFGSDVVFRIPRGPAGTSSALPGSPPR